MRIFLASDQLVEHHTDFLHGQLVEHHTDRDQGLVPSKKTLGSDGRILHAFSKSLPFQPFPVFACILAILLGHIQERTSVCYLCT